MAPEFQIPMDDVPSDWPTLDDSLVYDVRIVAAELDHAGPNAKMPGEPYINVEMETTAPPEWEGKTLYDILNLPGNVKPTDTVAERRKKLERGIRLKQVMEAFRLTWSPNGTFNTDDWVGSEARCDIRNDEWEGRMRSKPKRYYQK